MLSERQYTTIKLNDGLEIRVKRVSGAVYTDYHVRLISTRVKTPADLAFEDSLNSMPEEERARAVRRHQELRAAELLNPEAVTETRALIVEMCRAGVVAYRVGEGEWCPLALVADETEADEGAGRVWVGSFAEQELQDLAVLIWSWSTGGKEAMDRVNRFRRRPASAAPAGSDGAALRSEAERVALT
jgi:hypothetical protein